MIGAGVVVDCHLAGLAAAGGAEARAIVARSTARAEALAAAYAVPKTMTDWRLLLKRRDIDAVVVSTPDDIHCEIAAALLAAGKAVLVQKPMAGTSDECWAMLAAARSSGSVLEVSFMHRLLLEVLWAGEFLTSGTVLSARWRNATPGLDWANWFYKRAMVGGGVVLQLGIHGIDLIDHLVAGIEAVTAITALHGRNASCVTAAASPTMRTMRPRSIQESQRFSFLGARALPVQLRSVNIPALEFTSQQS